MRILFIGDPHVKTDNHDAIALLLLETERVLREIADEFTNSKVDAIVVAGDVLHYHERLFTPALNCALAFLDRLRRLAKTYVLVGNHDAINNSIFLTDQHWMNALKSWDNLVVVDRVLVGEGWMMCPYVPPGRFIEALETRCPPEEWQRSRIIFAHQEFRGCKMGAITSVDGDEWRPEWPLVLSGHIHDRQRVAPNIYYPGAPLQHAFGDSDTRVLCSIEWGTEGAPVIRDYPLRVPTKKIVKTESAAALTESVERILAQHSDNTAVKVKAEMSSEEFSVFKKTEAYRQMMDKGVRIQLMAAPKAEIDQQGVTGTFSERLQSLVEADEELVRSLYEEVVLEKMVIDLI